MASRIEIHYCSKCRWMLRSAWMAQELLSTFEDSIEELTLRPDSTGGVFEIFVDSELIWSRKDQGGFPDIVALKNLVRDRVAPEKDLGHAEQGSVDENAGASD